MIDSTAEHRVRIRTLGRVPYSETWHAMQSFTLERAEIVDMLDDVDLGGLEQTHLGSKYKDVLDNEDFDAKI